MAIPVGAAVPPMSRGFLSRQSSPVASPCPVANRVVAPASQPPILAVVPSALPLVPPAVPHACPFTRRPFPRGYPRPGRDARRA